VKRDAKTHKRRLLHVVGDSKFGGGSFVVLRLAEMAQAAGYAVDVLTTDHVFQQLLAEHDIGVVPLDTIRRSINPVRDLIGLFSLWRFLRRARYDLVHTHTSKAGFVGRLAARAARVPAIVHTVHGFAFHEESNKWVRRAYVLLERIAACACDRVVTVSEYHRAWAQSLRITRARKLCAIPNGIPAARASATQDARTVRRELGLPLDTLMLLATGRLAPQKGFAYLIHAAAALKERCARPFRIVIVGTGPLLPALMQLASDLGVLDVVRFTGFRSDVDDLVAAADMCVLPSLWEGLSIALLEAMAAGKPIVTTDIGSNREATRDGAAATLVPPKDTLALARAITEFINDPAAAADCAHRARAVFNQHFTEERMLADYRALYEQLLNPKTSETAAPANDAHAHALPYAPRQEVTR